MAKSKYESHVLPKLTLIEAWARDGVTDENIAKNLGIAYSTFRKYRDEHEALSTALARGKEVVDVEVENALLKKCLGYNAKITKHYKLKTVYYDEETGKRVAEKEELVAAQDEVHVPADTTAQMFWLANRKPGSWRYKPEGKDKDNDDEGQGVILLPEVMEHG